MQQCRAAVAELTNLLERSGLVTRDYSDEAARMRFSHHQIQEYLAAQHIVTSRDEIDWGRLLDHPRWQETLLHVVSSMRNLAAYDVLCRSLDEAEAMFAALDGRIGALEGERAKVVRERNSIRPDRSHYDEYGLQHQTYSDAAERQRAALQKQIDVFDQRIRDERWTVPPELERWLADRTVLAARVLREMGDASRVSEAFLAAYRRAVLRLVEQGRPTSQVKMLLAFEYAPEIFSRAELSSAFGSEIRWVRDHAIEVLGRVVVRSRGSLSEVYAELLFDAVRGTLWRHLSAHLRAARTSARWQLGVAWAAFIDLSFGMACIAVAGATLAALVPADQFGVLLGVTSGALLVGAPFGHSPLARRAPLTAGVTGALWQLWSLNLGYAAATLTLAGVGYVMVGGGALLLMSAPIALSVGAGDTRRLVGSAMAWHGYTTEVGTLGAAALLAALGALYVVTMTVLPYLEPIVPVVAALMVALLVLGLLATVLAFLSNLVEHPVAALRELGGMLGALLLFAIVMALWTVLSVGGVAVCLVVIACAARAVATLIPPGTDALVGQTAGFVAGGIAAVAVGAALLGWLYAAWRVFGYHLLQFVPSPVRPAAPRLTASQWERRFRSGAAEQQAWMLENGSLDSLMSHGQALELLERAEAAVRADPAATAYWRRRDELESILRQGRPRHTDLGEE